MRSLSSSEIATVGYRFGFFMAQLYTMSAHKSTQIIIKSLLHSFRRWRILEGMAEEKVLRWLSNSPKDERLVHRSVEESPDEAIARHRRWLEGKVIGKPRSSPYFTVEQLEEMGYIGVYVEEPREGA